MASCTTHTEPQLKIHAEPEVLHEFQAATQDIYVSGELKATIYHSHICPAWRSVMAHGLHGHGLHGLHGHMRLGKGPGSRC